MLNIISMIVIFGSALLRVLYDTHSITSVKIENHHLVNLCLSI